MLVAALIVAVAIGARHAHPWLIPAFPPATLAITYRLLLLGGELFKWSA